MGGTGKMNVETDGTTGEETTGTVETMTVTGDMNLLLLREEQPIGNTTDMTGTGTVGLQTAPLSLIRSILPEVNETCSNLQQVREVARLHTRGERPLSPLPTGTPDREPSGSHPRQDSEVPAGGAEEGEAMDATNDDDAAMMAMMGLTGFGTTKVSPTVSSA